MPTISRNLIRTAILFATVLSTSAFAAPITYLFRSNVNGSLNGSSVAGAFTLTAQGDTNNITFNGNVYLLVPSSVMIDLAGQSLTLNAPTTYVFDNLSANKVGFGVNGLPTCCDIIQHERVEYSTYNLQSAIGPLGVVNNLSINSFASVPTSGGLLTLTTMESNTFQAVTGSVPEPGSIALLASGTVALLLARRRRRNQ